MSMGLQIVAVGARTPVGLRAESSAAAVCAGISRVRRHPSLFDEEGEPLRTAFDARLEPELPAWRRIAALAASAIGEVVEKTEHVIPPSERFVVLLSLPETRPGFSEADARKVAEAVLAGAEGSSRQMAVEVVGRGHAGALEAFEAASKSFAAGRAPYQLVCGAESYLEEETLDWLEAHRRLTRKGVRNGFTPGEAAGAVLLASADVRHRSSAAPAPAPMAAVRGVGTGMEPRTILSGKDSLGEGLSRAIEKACSDLRLPEEAVDAVWCDINGERYRTEEWGFALLRSQGGIKTTDYELLSSPWGDVGAATVPLQCIMAVQAWRRGHAAGRRAMICAGSDGGLRGAAVLEAPKSSKPSE
jgi:3-oxoacyl-[acyl-carrier-protein] synthase I